MKLRHWLLTTVSAVALTGAANAADLPPVKARSLYSPDPVANWTGFYGGVHGGVARLNYSQTNIDENGLCGDYDGTTCATSATGGVLGAQIGYNYQMGSWVWGVEADFSWTDLSDTVVMPNYPNSFKGGVDWLGSLRGRSGLAVDNTFIYVTGGLAFGRLNSGWGAGYTGSPLSPTDSVVTDTKFGWVAGVGVEHKLLPNVSVRSEVLYYDLGRVSQTNTFAGFGTYRTEFSHEIFSARIGVNFHW